MDIKILHSWLLEYLDTDASARKIGECLALCGPSCERVTKIENDWVYEIEVTTNRVDMMSVYGIAREAAAILPQFGIKASLKPLQLNKPEKVSKSLPLEIETNKDLTHRVMAIILDNIEIKDSPDFIKKRLAAAEIRSLNNVIDITNYVMCEIGHPCHVFDYDKIKNKKLIFRLSKKGDKLTTLDDKSFCLPGEDIVIDDGDGTIIDLPGIMGTKNSVVDNNTKRIIFFIDNNDAKLMRKTSMTLGIRTVAVTLNEKHVDPQLGEKAVYRAVQLYEEFANAKVVSKLHDLYLNKPRQKTINITLQFIEDKMGVELDSDKVVKTLETLGFKVKILKQKIQNTRYEIQYTITIPSWRSHDIDIPEDIIEEVARIYGYHNLPSIIPTGDFPLPNPQESNFYWEKVTKNCLKNWGYTENYNYSLISEDLLNKVNKNPESFLKLKNPLIEDWVYLRKSLAPSLLQSLANNQDRQGDIEFFEMANVYLPRHSKTSAGLPIKNYLPNETLRLAIINNTQNSYFKVKGILESLATELGIKFTFKKTSSYKILDKNIQAEIYINKTKLGYIGNVNSNIVDNFSLKKTATIAQINFDEIVKHATKNKIYIPIPKFPPIIEDLTFFNNENIEAQKILSTAQKSDSLINKVTIKDFFENKITLQITYLDKNKNLEASDIIPIRKKLVENIEKLSLQLQGQI